MATQGLTRPRRVSRPRRKVVFENPAHVELLPFLADRVRPTKSYLHLHPGPEFDQYVDFSWIEHGAHLGCALCIIGELAFTRFYDDEARNRPLSCVNPHRGVIHLALKGEKIRSCEIYTTSHTKMSWWKVGSQRVRPVFKFRHTAQDTASKQTVQQAARWIRKCRDSHADCSSNGPFKLPSRLIDVVTLCLVDTSSISGEYACLSHCWGPPHALKSILRTTASNVDALKKAIPPETLPPTFRDAISFTRALGIPYLWIDSLCIVQDSESDWERESASMAAIYANSTVTLAASLSADATGGLYRATVPALQIGHVYDAKGRCIPLLIRKIYHQDPHRALCPLSKRAWVLQETILAPRTLYFMQSELFFECRTHSYCECTLGLQAVNPKRHFWLRQRNICLSSPAPSPAHTWRDLIVSYMSMALTVPSDILPAISGLAQALRAANPALGSYLAGFWRANLPLDLLWYPSALWTSGGNALPGRRRVRPWRAPSWSWASVEADSVGFCLMESMGMLAAELLDAQCTLAGIDPTGAITAGHVVLRGKALHGKVYVEQRVHIHDDREKLLHNGSFCIGDAELEFYLDFPVWDAGMDAVAPGAEVTALLITRPLTLVLDDDPIWRESWETLWAFLILKPVEDGVFERIGLLHVMLGDRRKGDNKKIFGLVEDAQVEECRII